MLKKSRRKDIRRDFLWGTGENGGGVGGHPALRMARKGEAGRTATGGYGIRPYGVGVDVCIDPGN